MSDDYCVHVGAPAGGDLYAYGVFDRALHHAVRVPIFSVTNDGIRDAFLQAAGVARTVSRERSRSLDIIADAPTGIQTFHGLTLRDFMDDPEFIDRVSGAFSQCRLLGCSTAGTEAGRALMCELSLRWGMTVMGTTAGVGWKSFGNTGILPGPTLENEQLPRFRSARDGAMISVSHQAESNIRDGLVQAAWLAGFAQIPFDPGDLCGIPGVQHEVIRPMGDLTALVRDGQVAATDSIDTRAQIEIAFSDGRRTIPAHVLAAGTLLRMHSRESRRPVYVSVPSGSELGQAFAALLV